MRILVVSDLHGSLFFGKKAIELYEEEQADKILCLGDVLYHGPRNPLTKDYNPKDLAVLLNAHKEKIIAVRGNCDSEVDQMVLEFPIMSDFSTLFLGGITIFATHGHIYNKTNMPSLGNGDVFIHGHFHLPMAEKHGNYYYLNPGSISLPKENNPNSYGVITEDGFEIKDLQGNIIKEISFKA